MRPTVLAVGSLVPLLMVWAAHSSGKFVPDLDPPGVQFLEVAVAKVSQVHGDTVLTVEVHNASRYDVGLYGFELAAYSAEGAPLGRTFVEGRDLQRRDTQVHELPIAAASTTPIDFYVTGPPLVFNERHVKVNVRIKRMPDHTKE